ncbi:MAG: hypothetical protein ACPG6V_07285 [Flavobacteriales bacterium]
MKTIYFLCSVCLFLISSCNSDDDASNSTGNTLEYFKYTVDGVERVFDHEVEGHYEVTSNASVRLFEINASGLYASEGVRRIAAVFSFRNPPTTVLNTNNYPWGLQDGTSSGQYFYFSESTPNHPFVLDLYQPINAQVTSAIPVNVGDYIEFSFSGMFTDQYMVSHTLSGVCRTQRELDQ